MPLHAKFWEGWDYQSYEEILDTEFVTINGQYVPTLNVTAGTAQRWRMVNALQHRYLFLELVMLSEPAEGTSSSCSMLLLFRSSFDAEGERQHLRVFRKVLFVVVVGR